MLADFFGLFRVPQFTSENRADASFYGDWHICTAYVLMGLVGLHLLAAIHHRFLRGDRIMQRMASGEERSPPRPGRCEGFAGDVMT